MEHSYIDKYCERDSFLHRLNARTKFLSFFLFIVLITATPPQRYVCLIAYFVIVVMLVCVSKVPVKHFAKSLIEIIPFAIFIVIFVPFFKKSSEGLVIVWNVVVKSFLSILIITLLSSTTKFHHLLAGLQKLHFPKLFIMNLSFMYRYIFVLLDEKMRIERAVASRHHGKIKNFHKVFGSVIGSLFIRTYQRSERIYSAMCSRLFDGDIKTLGDRD